MSDPKQIAHDKKVAQAKKHNHEEIGEAPANAI